MEFLKREIKNYRKYFVNIIIVFQNVRFVYNQTRVILFQCFLSLSLLNENLERRQTWPSSNPIRETPSDSAQFDVICENPIRSDRWNSVISSVYAFSRDATSLSPTIQHPCLTSLAVEHFLIHWLQTSILLGRNWWCGTVTN